MTTVNRSAAQPPELTNVVTTLDIAFTYLASGLSIIPIRADGSKRPDVARWDCFQTALPEENRIRVWWRENKSGIGVICGKVSGNLECIDFDRGSLYAPWCEMIEEAVPGLVARLCVVQTPREPSGYHIRYRCLEVTIPGNMKLAQEPSINQRTGKPCAVTLIETRGEGGYALAPGSPPSCHPTGRTWEHISGPSLTQLPVITAAERELLIDAARSFDLATAAKMHGAQSGTNSGPSGVEVLRPGDDYDLRGPDWPEILEPHGWQRAHCTGETQYWRRPGKDTPGTSASTGYCKAKNGSSLFAVFSSNADPFDGPTGSRSCTCYTKFAAFTMLNYGGDFKAAAKDLAHQKYGSKRRQGNSAALRARASEIQNVHEAAGGAISESAPIAGAEGPPHGDSPDEALNDPHRLARSYLEKQVHADRPRLAFFREQFSIWKGTHWCVRPDAEIRGELARHCKRQLDADFAVLSARPTDDERKRPTVPKVTTGLVANVMQALSGEVMLPQETPQPVWLGSDPQQRNYLAMRNGLVDVDALLRGEHDVVRPHSPWWFSPACLPYNFDHTADCPRWFAFLTRNLEGLFSSKSLLLQQFAGYLLLPNTSLQRFLLMTGEGANGKSVICAVLRAFLGEDNISTVPLEMFGDKFRLAGTLGKLANIAAEVGELDKVAEGQLKAFVTGDLLEFERKFKTPFAAKPTARLVLATNNPPQFNDKSDGLWRRMLLLKCLVQIPETERVAGMDSSEWWRDAGELPGILNWAIAGLYQLRQQGRFSVPADCQEEVDRMRGDLNPARRFLVDHCRAGIGEVEKAVLYQRYKTWCKDNGHHPLASNKLAVEVFRTFPGAKEGKPTRAGVRIRTFTGVEMRSDDW